MLNYFFIMLQLLYWPLCWKPKCIAGTSPAHNVAQSRGNVLTVPWQRRRNERKTLPCPLHTVLLRCSLYWEGCAVTTLGPMGSSLHCTTACQLTVAEVRIIKALFVLRIHNRKEKLSMKKLFSLSNVVICLIWILLTHILILFLSSIQIYCKVVI